jgi:hypothetical protein
MFLGCYMLMGMKSGYHVFFQRAGGHLVACVCLAISNQLVDAVDLSHLSRSKACFSPTVMRVCVVTCVLCRSVALCCFFLGIMQAAIHQSEPHRHPHVARHVGENACVAHRRLAEADRTFPSIFIYYSADFSAFLKFLVLDCVLVRLRHFVLGRNNANFCGKT